MSFVITVDVSDRTYDAIMKLANALGANIKTTPTEPVTTQPAPSPAPAAAKAPIFTAPVPTTSAPAATPAAPVAPAPTPVPTAPAPTYTLEQLTVAAAPLIDAGKINELCDVINSFGVQSLQELPPERYDEYATAIRALGAKI